MQLLYLQESSDDDPQFAEWVESTVHQVLGRAQPKEFQIIKIDNWFGSRWLNFSGKYMGALGLRKPTLTVPPFVPSRVISQQRFVRVGPSDTYVAKKPSKRLHISQTSGDNLLRRAQDVAPTVALFWYSGASQANERGSLMGYVPIANEYWTWYMGAVRNKVWTVDEVAGNVSQEMRVFQ